METLGLVEKVHCSHRKHTVSVYLQIEVNFEFIITVTVLKKRQFQLAMFCVFRILEHLRVRTR